MAIRNLSFRNQRALGMQQGQALAEFPAISVAMVPLFLLIPVIAKYQDISNSTQMASRYEVRRRFFQQFRCAHQDQRCGRRFFGEPDLFWTLRGRL